MVQKYALELKNVCYGIRPHFYSRFIAVLERFNLKIPSGCSMGIIGSNGAGKTTTLKLSAGILLPNSGEILLNGEPVSAFSAKGTLGFLSESPYVYPHLKLIEWLSMMGRLSGLSGRQLAIAIDQHLDLLGLEDKKKALMNTLSKGQLQRACFAQTCLHSPDLFILDEPMSGMDPFWRSRIKDILLDLKIKGKTLVFSSHIISDILRLSDEMILIESGVIKWKGGMHEWPRKHLSFYAIFKTDCMQSISQEVQIRSLTSYPDGSYGGRIHPKDKETLIRKADQNILELISLMPEYDELKGPAS